MNGACQPHQKLATDTTVWTAAELLADRTWIHNLEMAELRALRRVTHAAQAQEPSPNQIEQSGFLPPALKMAIGKIHHHLKIGRGLFLLRGLNVKDYNLDQLLMLCSKLAFQLGYRLVPQSLSGDLVRLVTDSEELWGESNKGGHRSRAEMLPHSDSAEFVGLICVRSAKSGGATSVCSSSAVHNEIIRRNAHHIIPLLSGFHFDLAGKTEAGVSRDRIPVFAYYDGRVVCHFNRSRIETGMQKAGVLLSVAEKAALNHMSELTQRPDLSVRFELRPGDILLLNNSSVLHAREAYEDWPEPDCKRLLIRLWLTASGGQDGLETHR